MIKVPTKLTITAVISVTNSDLFSLMDFFLSQNADRLAVSIQLLKTGMLCCRLGDNYVTNLSARGNNGVSVIRTEE